VVGIVAGLDRDAIGQACIEWPVRRPQMKFQSALVAPALQFDHPEALPHRAALIKASRWSPKAKSTSTTELLFTAIS
jgi:hypothetical protein